MKLNDLSPWDRNPRKITERSAVGLKESMARYGDIAGIVYNRRNNALVCGHRRVEQARSLAQGADPEITMADDEESGVMHIGTHAFAVRFVDWDDETHAAAAIAANSQAIAGQWTEELEPLLRELREVDLEGFEALRFDDLASDQGIIAPNFEPTEEPESRLDEKAKATCPECGVTFVP